MVIVQKIIWQQNRILLLYLRGRSFKLPLLGKIVPILRKPILMFSRYNNVAFFFVF